MKKRVLYVLLILSVLLAVSLPSAIAEEEMNIVQALAADGRFNTLGAAITAADLTDTLSSGEWTLFAPTDDAFAKMELNASNVATSFTTAELQDLLLYHALAGEYFADKAQTVLGDCLMANGRYAGLKFYEDELYLNDDAKVIITDIDASNGAIHGLDTVITGPWPKPAPPAGPAAPYPSDTIFNLIAGDERFDTLQAAITAAGLTDTLSTGQWTLFAPTDEAFAKMGLNPGNIATSFTAAELQDLLLYHVLADEYFADKARTILGDLIMANNRIAGLKFYEDELYLNDDAKVIITNINAANGAIHGVDTVILGPWPR